MGQMQGRDAPSAQNEPGGQLPQNVDPAAAANVPALHCSHCAAPDWEKLPALHGTGAIVPFCGQQLPASHGVQVAWLEAPMVGE
jgi:hypothetical protein